MRTAILGVGLEMGDRYRLGWNDCIDDMRRVLSERKVQPEGQHSRDAAATDLANKAQAFLTALQRSGALPGLPRQKEMTEHYDALNAAIARMLDR